MYITVRVKPKSKQPSVTDVEEGGFIVAVHEAPRDGQANAAVVKAIAKHFCVAPSRVRIIRGLASRKKIVTID